MTEVSGTTLVTAYRAVACVSILLNETAGGRLATTLGDTTAALEVDETELELDEDELELDDEELELEDEELELDDDELDETLLDVEDDDGDDDFVEELEVFKVDELLLGQEGRPASVAFVQPLEYDLT